MPNGATWQWVWDYFGRPVVRKDLLGGVSRATYSDTGKLLRLQGPGNRDIRFEWDSMGLRRSTAHQTRCRSRWPTGTRRATRQLRSGTEAKE